MNTLNESIETRTKDLSIVKHNDDNTTPPTSSIFFFLFSIIEASRHANPLLEDTSTPIAKQ